jgi:hypothetical protein
VGMVRAVRGMVYADGMCAERRGGGHPPHYGAARRRGGSAQKILNLKRHHPMREEACMEYDAFLARAYSPIEVHPRRVGVRAMFDGVCVERSGVWGALQLNARHARRLRDNAWHKEFLERMREPCVLLASMGSAK